MFIEIRNSDSLNAPIDLQNNLYLLFNKTSKLIHSERQGFGNIELTELVQLKYLKNILKFKTSTLNYMIYAESGRTPLYLDIKEEAIAFRSRICNINPMILLNKLSAKSDMCIEIY